VLPERELMKPGPLKSAGKVGMLQSSIFSTISLVSLLVPIFDFSRRTSIPN
jgi:hypothetical protein